MTRVPPASTQPDPEEFLRHLTVRDYVLLHWLAEHYVLPTRQIKAALFPSLRTAQRRLTVLHRIGALSRFRFDHSETDPVLYRIGAVPEFLIDRTGTDSVDLRYTMGPLGVEHVPMMFEDPDNPDAKPPRSHLARRRRVSRSPNLRHLIGVNQFFTDLFAHARTHPDAKVLRWWSEQHATKAYPSARTGTQIHPDGHGIWRVGGQSVGFFLENDYGTEGVPLVLDKLKKYEHLAKHENGPRYPVLLWVPTAARQRSLLRAMSGVPLPIPVAVGVHSRTPAGPIWAVPDRPDARLHLHELPSDPMRDPGA